MSQPVVEGQAGGVLVTSASSLTSASDWVEFSALGAVDKHGAILDTIPEENDVGEPVDSMDNGFVSWFGTDWWTWVVLGLAIAFPTLCIIVCCCWCKHKRHQTYLDDRLKMRPRDALNKPSMQLVTPGVDAPPLKLDRARVPGNIGLGFMSAVRLLLSFFLFD